MLYVWLVKNMKAAKLPKAYITLVKWLDIIYLIPMFSILTKNVCEDRIT